MGLNLGEPQLVGPVIAADRDRVRALRTQPGSSFRCCRNAGNSGNHALSGADGDRSNCESLGRPRWFPEPTLVVFGQLEKTGLRE